jgi:hypothetical protein
LIDVTDALNHCVHLPNLPIVIDEHDIVASYRGSLPKRSKLPLQHHQIAIDPDVPTRSESPSWVAVKKLRDEIVDGIEAIDQLVGVVEVDVFIVSRLHLGKTFGRIALAEYAQQIVFCELFGMLSRDCCHVAVDFHETRCNGLSFDQLAVWKWCQSDIHEIIWQHRSLEVYGRVN